jgi:hypothetical protein
VNFPNFLHTIYILAVKLPHCTRKILVHISARTPITIIGGFCGFRYPFQENGGIVKVKVTP